MDLLNPLLNFVAPPVSLVMLAFSWPTLYFLHAVEWIFRDFFREDMEDKVVVITGASSAIGEQIAYEYARRKANLVLVARREQRLFGIRENARLLGAKHVLVLAADVVKEVDCKRFIGDTVSYFGRLDHLVNTANLGHNFFFENAADSSVFPHLMDINFWGNVYPTYVALPFLRQSHGRIIVNASVESWLPMPRMSLYAAAKAATMNFYETLRFEVKDDVGITIATHGWIGTETSSTRKFMLKEGAEMQWKEEREVPLTGKHVEGFAKLIVSGLVGVKHMLNIGAGTIFSCSTACSCPMFSVGPSAWFLRSKVRVRGEPRKFSEPGERSSRALLLLGGSPSLQTLPRGASEEATNAIC